MPSLWIIDSGSSKTDVACLDSGHLIFRDQLPPYNAHQHDINRLREIHDSVSRNIGQHRPDRIIHYCSGATPDRTNKLIATWESLSPATRVEVYSDIYALAHILDQPGWLAIIGTGSNLSRYDGHLVLNEVRSLGWLVGDEGSSRDIARELLRLYCREMLHGTTHDELHTVIKKDPTKVIPLIQDERGLKNVIDTINSQMAELSKLKPVLDVIHERVQRFLDLMPITRMRGSRVIFTGGVACNHSGFIRDFLNSHQIEHQFIRFPIDALIDHYGKRDQ